ncbi:MAG: DUF4258 domain-containing protein [Microvirga sp.]
MPSEERAGPRDIDLAWIQAAVERPDEREDDPAGDGRARSYKAIPERDGRVLRVVYVQEEPDLARVLTAFFDRGRTR